MDDPAVSVIIPAHNAARFLRETLETVARQTFKDFETIVIDDGSTDDTATIAQDFGGVQYYYQRNQGPAAARNFGLEKSRGRYLAFMDADDLWHEEMLSACVSVLNKRPEISAVHTNWQIVDEHGRVVRQWAGWLPWRGNIFERLLVEIPLINPAIVWRRLCFEEIGGFDQTPEVNDDWLNWLRIAYRGHLFECLEQPLASYRQHGGNLTHTQSFRVIEWRQRSLELLFSEVEVGSQLRKRAYAQVHWVKSMAALACFQIDEAAHEFAKAVTLDEQLLWQAETYYAIAHGGSGRKGSGVLDIGKAATYLGRFLAAVKNPRMSGNTERHRKAWGEAYFHLARMAYDAEGIASAEARAYILRAIRENPKQFAQRERAQWAVRIVIGRNGIGAMRRFKALAK